MDISQAILPLMIIVFYFFFIRPQMQKAKKTRQFQTDLSKGQRVVTTGGIHGKIVQIDENNPTILLEVDSGTKIRVERSLISMDLSVQDQKAKK